MTVGIDGTEREVSTPQSLTGCSPNKSSEFPVASLDIIGREVARQKRHKRYENLLKAIGLQRPLEITGIDLNQEREEADARIKVLEAYMESLTQ